MGSPLRAKILNILGNQNLALNAGKNKGISRGMKFDVLARENQSTKRVLIKGRLKVVEVYEKFSLAEIYETIQKETIDVGDDVLQIT